MAITKSKFQVQNRPGGVPAGPTPSRCYIFKISAAARMWRRRASALLRMGQPACCRGDFLPIETGLRGWRMQSAANLSLPAIWEMQGDFRKMQGDARRTLAKSHQISIACMAFSLLQRAGRSRVAYLALAGFVSSIRGRSSDFGCSGDCLPEMS